MLITSAEAKDTNSSTSSSATKLIFLNQYSSAISELFHHSQFLEMRTGCLTEVRSSREGLVYRKDGGACCTFKE